MNNKNFPGAQDPQVRKASAPESSDSPIAADGLPTLSPPPPVDSNESKAPAKPKKPDHVHVHVETGSLADFEALLAGESFESPRARVQPGDKVGGVVTKVGEKYLYVELDGRIEGLASTIDYPDTKEGDRLDFYVIHTRGGTVELGKSMSTRDSGLDALEHAYSAGLPVEGRVSSRNKGGFEIDFKGVAAFCPLSQIEAGFTEDPDEHLGKTYRFKITDIREDGRNVVVSRSALIQEERAAAAQETLATLQEGQVVQGTVTRLADFGAFVDLGGIEGLVHVSEIGHARIAHPSEALKEGELVSARVLKMEEGPKGLRIGLSIKDTLSDPWESRISEFAEGSKIEGRVTRVEPFGAFVEIAPGLEGLVHISEMSNEHVKRASDVVKVGQTVNVEIQSIDTARKRLSLSMKEAGEDVWSEIDQHFVVGQKVSGAVENIEDFGVFVRLQGATALLPRSEMGLARDATPHRLYKTGQTVEAKILEIDPIRRRIALTVRSDEELERASEEASAPRSFVDKGASSSLGTFGELLQKKLK